MALSVNTNIASLNAQRNLTESGSKLNVSLERLSTGLRINSAKDDAAGLAISERFTTQIRGMNVAIRNSNDGISLAQTAEGALGGLTDSLQRIRELAVQSANATNSASDRQALQDEVSQLLLEIDRVARETSFNGVNLLDGTFTSQQFQVGANAGQTITVDSIANARTASLGETFSASATGTVDNVAYAANTLSFNGIFVGATSDDGSGSGLTNSNASAKAKAFAINNANIAGVTADVSTTDVTSGTVSGFADLVAGDLTVNGVQITTTGTTTADEQGAAIATAIGNIDGLTATYDATADTFAIQATDGRNITVATGTGGAANTGFADSTTTTTNADLTVNSTLEAPVTVFGADGAGGGIGAGLAAVTTNIGIDDLSVATVDQANVALAAADSALNTLNGARATLGAVQSRFETVISNLSITSENLTASRGRILDADFAAETANLTKTQILQQAGVAILAQANGLPQLALSLLQ